MKKIAFVALASLAMCASQAAAEETGMTHVDIASVVLEDSEFADDVSYAAIGASFVLRVMAERQGVIIECAPEVSFLDAVQAHSVVVLRDQKKQAAYTARSDAAVAMGSFALGVVAEICGANE